MSIVAASHVELVRARKELVKSFEAGNWKALREWDNEVGLSLSKAFNDEARNTKALVDELERILSTYAEIVASLPGHSIALATHPDGSITIE